MGRIGDEPEVVLDTSGVRHLVWRGYLMGGLITVWLRLGPALRSAGLPASAKSHQPRDLGIELVEENRFLAARRWVAAQDGAARQLAPRS